MKDELMQMLQYFPWIENGDIFYMEYPDIDCTYAELKQALSETGYIRKEERETGSLWGIVPVGALKRGTAALALRVQDGQLYAAAFSADGPLPKMTAQKGVERVLNSL